MVIGRYYSIWYVACARCGEARACNNNVGGQCCPVCGCVCDKDGGTEAWLSTLRLAPSPSPRPPSSPALRTRKGEVSGAMAILRLCLAMMPRPPTRSPRSRSAGAGLGVRAAPSPSPRPPSSPALRARKGEESGAVVTWVLYCSPPTCGRGRGR